MMFFLYYSDCHPEAESKDHNKFHKQNPKTNAEKKICRICVNQIKRNAEIRFNI
jgi:hypothetical protein